MFNLANNITSSPKVTPADPPLGVSVAASKLPTTAAEIMRKLQLSSRKKKSKSQDRSIEASLDKMLNSTRESAA